MTTIEQHDLQAMPMRQPLRVRLASLSTASMLVGALDCALQRHFPAAAVEDAGFGSIMPELLSPRAAEAEILVVVLDEQGLPRRDWRQTAADAETQYDAWIAMLTSALRRYVDTVGARVLVNTVPQPVAPAVGFLDAAHSDGQTFRINRINAALRETAAARANLHVIESDAALAGVAPAKRSDAKLWFYGRIPFTAAADTALADAFAETIGEIDRSRPKVLALDLDDTLWRGIFGECGVLGVECGDDFPGNAFKAMQEECLRLKSQGMLLTILSKNDPDAIEVLDKHPGMLLRRSDFVGMRINWSPKAANIRELAAEIGVGLDTFLFIDDSPHEREAMRRLAPDVRVLDLPADPALRPGALRACRQTWPLRLTEEDLARTEMYAARLGAQSAQASIATVEDYLDSLQQALVVQPVTERSLVRIGQMHERTNQFNLTTRRLSQGDLSAMMEQPDRYLLLQGHVRDRFGDHGVVICATVELFGDRARIMSLLMSCRVIGRDIEVAFLGALIDALRERGVERVEAQFIATSRNGPAASFLGRCGLERDATAEDEGEIWTWSAGTIAVPRSKAVEVGS